MDYLGIIDYRGNEAGYEWAEENGLMIQMIELQLRVFYQDCAAYVEEQQTAVIDDLDYEWEA